LPAAWRVGHKTGTGANGAVNDVAIAWPPGRSAIVVACYLSESRAAPAELSAVHAQVGRIIAAELAG
jgi:beta-lactamase class A